MATLYKLVTGEIIAAASTDITDERAEELSEQIAERMTEQLGGLKAGLGVLFPGI